MQTTFSAEALLGRDPYAMLVAEIRDFAILLIDLDGLIASWNQGARLLFGYESEEILGQSAARLFVPEDRDQGVPERELSSARREGRAEDVRWHLRKDGSRFWASGVTTALRDEAGQVLGFAKVARDDTERKRIEDDLRASQQRFELVARATSDAVWDWELGSDHLWWNSSLETVFGHPSQEARPFTWWQERVHPDDRGRVMAEIRGVIARGEMVWKGEHRFERADGSFAHVLNGGTILRDAAGAPIRILGAIKDVSERRELEEKRLIFEQLADNSPDFMAMCDLRFRPIYGNPMVRRLLGVRNAEMAKNPRVEDYFFPEDVPWIFSEFFPRVIREGQGITEIRLRHLETGEAIWMSYQLFVLRDTQGAPVALATISRDISARKAREAEREELMHRLEFERGRFSTMFENAPAFVAVFRGPNHIFELVNPAYYRLVGERGELVGRKLRDALPEVEGQGFITLLDDVLTTGKPFEGRELPAQLRRIRRGPLEQRFIDLLFHPLYEANGEISGVFVHGIDITDQVRARQEAEDANRFKDEFLATLSHELRTPLTAIMGWANILQAGDLNAEDTARAVDTIERNARAQSQLIEDILDVSRVITGKLRLEVQPVDLAGIIEDAVATVTPAAGAKDIRLQRTLDAGASLVSGDPARLGQIVWNLLSNAIKFTPRGGRVQVRLERINSHVEIIISDSGLGIAPDVLPHVFERFRQADSSSTRTHGGLGLGLAIVRHLSELHGGNVEASSQGVGTGAIFTVRLPLIAVRAANEREGDSPRVRPRAARQGASGAMPRLDGLHVLVVDDQEDTRVLLAAVLEPCGARVTLTRSASEAFAALQTLRPDVLVSDIGMPGEDGFSLIKQVRALAPEQGGQTPSAALTAFARVEDRVKILRAGFQIHLPKPVEPLELATVVANLAGRRDEE